MNLLVSRNRELINWLSSAMKTHRGPESKAPHRYRIDMGGLLHALKKGPKAGLNTVARLKVVITNDNLILVFQSIFSQFTVKTALRISSCSSFIKSLICHSPTL
jgi:hypothetical protein